MTKRILAIALFLVMVSAFAVTGAVSATEVGQSSIRQYDVKFVEQTSGGATWVVYGKLTLNAETGYYTYTANLNKLSKASQDKWKARAGERHGIAVALGMSPEPTLSGVSFGLLTVSDGGTWHGEGYIQDMRITYNGYQAEWTVEDLVAWLDANSEQAWWGYSSSDPTA